MCRILSPVWYDFLLMHVMRISRNLYIFSVIQLIRDLCTAVEAINGSFLVMEHFTANLRDQAFTQMDMQGSCGQPLFKENCFRSRPYSTFWTSTFQILVNSCERYDCLQYAEKTLSSIIRNHLLLHYFPVISGVCIEYIYH